MSQETTLPKDAKTLAREADARVNERRLKSDGATRLEASAAERQARPPDPVEQGEVPLPTDPTDALASWAVRYVQPHPLTRTGGRYIVEASAPALRALLVRESRARAQDRQRR